MVFFSALVNINSIYCDTINGQAENVAAIDNAIAAQLFKRGNGFAFEIVEFMFSDTPEGLADRIAEGL
tara:strand:+ start:321 stop:524 length:204 start_codon:yes stop_codon:yes gene_type:complete